MSHMPKCCSECSKRPRKYRYKGRFSTDKQHDLCLQCFRNLSMSRDHTKFAGKVRLCEVAGC